MFTSSNQYQYVPCEVYANPGLPVGPPLNITLQATVKALDFVTNHSVESGGALFGPYEKGGISHFEPDHIGSEYASHTVYSPHSETLNIAAQRLHRKKMELKGILHTHPGNSGAYPSQEVRLGFGDFGYVRKFFIENESALHLFFPILTYTANKVTISPYVFKRHPEDKVPQLLYAPLEIKDPGSFGEWEYDPAWLASLEAEDEPNQNKEEQ